MYRKISNSWLKHWDFIVLDAVMLQVAYIFSCIVRNGWGNPYDDPIYLNIGLIIFFADICTAFFVETYHGIMRRGYFEELKNVIKHVGIVGLIEVSYLFLSKNGSDFSRIAFVGFILSSIVLIYAERTLWKLYLFKYRNLFYNKKKMLVVVSSEEAEAVIETIRFNNYNEFEIIGIVLADQKEVIRKIIKGAPVVCTLDMIPEYIQKRWVDSILFNVKRNQEIPEELIDICVGMGVVVHRKIMELQDGIGTQHVGKIGGYAVLTSSLRIATPRQILIKRAMDICGGLVGMILTGVLMIFLAPAIYIESPGPILFSQTRVGKNGKPFKIYKFRSMYMDAEQRKKELMERNQMRGLMFKMENDPRIIGSGLDGTKHGLGWFIRKTSLDEFPQFWNVLKGDMSLVGTRPPTVDEWNEYEKHHRARMAMKPGLTGMWQVSGRSDITDFEEVVKLDTEYIRNWGIGMDLKILLKTVAVVIGGTGAR